MKDLLVRAGLGVALGLLALTANAQEVQWQAVGSPPASPSADEVPWRSVRGQAPAEAETIAAPKDSKPSRLPDFSRTEGGPPAAACPTFAAPVKIPFQGSPEVKLERDWLADMPFANSGTGGRVWVRAEYLLWGVKNDQLPILATTSSPQDRGFLGQPTTRVLFGGQGVPNQLQSGFRVNGGVWLDECQTCGIDFGYFNLGRAGYDRTLSSDQYPVLSRPFFAVNPSLNREFAEQVAFPGVSTGTLNINGSTGLWGAQANLREVLCCNCCSRWELFAGFRYLNLDEDINITEIIVQGPNNPLGNPTGTLAVVNDHFSTRNQFYGPQIGAGYERKLGRFFLGATGQVALGVTHQTLTIEGSQRLTPPGGAPSFFTGGLLTTPSNIGRFESDRFSVVPEITLTAGYQLTRRLRVFGGYNFLYWSNVIRPGDQIDRVVDVTLVPNSSSTPAGVPFSGQLRPRVLFTQTDFWAQGLNLGLQYNW
jgi:hypothetical protein